MDASPIVVAIVDDDDAVRRALHCLVLSLSYQPLSFASGSTFLANLREATPNCVLMDQHMPGLNGLDVLREMRAQELHVPVIVTTGFDQPGLREKCLDAGAVAYLLKPLEASVLSDAIKAAIAV
jgi:FixJ family two-component response regulator